VVFGTVLVLIVALAAAAVLIGAYFRRSAEMVLRDYAGLAAERLGQRIETRLSVRLWPVVSAVRARVERGERPPSAVGLAEQLSGEAQELAARVQATFVVDKPRGPVRTTGAVTGADTTVIAEVAAAADTALDQRAYFGLAWPARHDGSVVAYSAVRDRDGTITSVYGVVLPLAVLRHELEQAGTPIGLLPTRLVERVAADSVLGLAISIARLGVVVDRQHDPASPHRSHDELEPRFGGITADVTLQPAAAPRLLAGGVPKSQVPQVAALAVLAVALLAVGWMLVRRERQVARLKEEFVAGVSHELRTPLAQIRLFADTLSLGRIRTDEERTRSLAIIGQETRRLTHLVDNLLHVARPRPSPAQPPLGAHDLSALVERVVGEFEPLVAGRGVLARRIEPGIVARLDPDQIRQILLNLLDNAMKYGPSGQTISIELAASDDRARLSVADEGPGVLPTHRPLVWRRFWRAPALAAQGIGGTGIGLAIVAELALRHCGEVGVESSGNGGACFWVSLPASRNGAGG
jgi:signal transduction histidine kinase